MSAQKIKILTFVGLLVGTIGAILLFLSITSSNIPISDGGNPTNLFIGGGPADSNSLPIATLDEGKARWGFGLEIAAFAIQATTVLL